MRRGEDLNPGHSQPRTSAFPPDSGPFPVAASSRSYRSFPDRTREMHLVVEGSRKLGGQGFGVCSVLRGSVVHKRCHCWEARGSGFLWVSLGPEEVMGKLYGKPSYPPVSQPWFPPPDTLTLSPSPPPPTPSPVLVLRLSLFWTSLGQLSWSILRPLVTTPRPAPLPRASVLGTSRAPRIEPLAPTHRLWMCAYVGVEGSFHRGLR